MKFDLAIIGFGVIGVESLHALVKNINKNQRLNVAIIDKDIGNIPGGVAYSKINSKFGFFNNPLRLSHPSFQSWIRSKTNINKIIDFIKRNPDYKLQEWSSINIENLEKKRVSRETYFPRLVYSFYLEDKILEIIEITKKLKLKLYFFQGFLQKIDFNSEHLALKSKVNFQSFKIVRKNGSFDIIKSKKINKFIESKKIIVGNGLLPPKKMNFSNKKLNNNYIWDFYTEGGTNNLLKKIENIRKKKNKIFITFIGNKAGLLESMLHIKYLIFEKNYNIQINVISKKFATLNKAKFSNNNKLYKFHILTTSRINKIKKSNEILNLLKKEFKIAILKKYNKYDVWTKILRENVLKKSIQKLSIDERKKYNLLIFPLIRNITRFTYPEPIKAKEYLDKHKKIKMIKGKAVSIKISTRNILINLENKKKIKSDIVVNVSGPVNLDNLNMESNFIKSIKTNVNKFDKRGFITDKNFMLTKQIYTPGILAYNFNPSRQTIIKAITNNSRKTINTILKTIK
jgi:hypothetical protein